MRDINTIFLIVYIILFLVFLINKYCTSANELISPADNSDLSETLKAIRDNFKIANDRLNKHLILTIWLSALYVLLLNSVITKIDLGITVIEDPMIIRVTLPLVVAYYYRELCSITYMKENIRRKHKELFSGANRDIEPYLNPISILTVHELICENYKNTNLGRLFKLNGESIDLLLVIGISLFQPYMVICNILEFRWAIGLIIISGITGALWLSGIMILYFINHQENNRLI